MLCDHVSHTRSHSVEMGCQMVQLLSAHIAGPTMCANLTLAIDYIATDCWCVMTEIPKTGINNPNTKLFLTW